MGGEQMEAIVIDKDSKSNVFLKLYYGLLDEFHESLADLYHQDSVLCFEGEKIQGVKNIVSKHISLSFQQWKHIITTVDCLPAGNDGSLMVSVKGTIVNLNDGTIINSGTIVDGGTLVNNGTILNGGKGAIKFSQVCLVISMPILPRCL